MGRKRIRTIVVDDRPGLVDEVADALETALAGGDALLPLPPGATASAVVAAARVDEPVTDDVALLVPTSGSTGAPKIVELTADALGASGRATAEFLGGQGS